MCMDQVAVIGNYWIVIYFYYVLVSTCKYTRIALWILMSFPWSKACFGSNFPETRLGSIYSSPTFPGQKGITLKLCQQLCGGELKRTRGEHTSVQFNQRLTVLVEKPTNTLKLEPALLECGGLKHLWRTYFSSGHPEVFQVLLDPITVWEIRRGADTFVSRYLCTSILILH